MTTPAANFDPLVRVYRALEWIAFGGDLARARFALLDRLAGCRSILVLGEGDGRCLARLLPLAAEARIHVLDASPAMLSRAKARIAGQAGQERVTFECADALEHDFPINRYDAVTTLFFLDCFDAAQAAELIRRVRPTLQPGAHWLLADFTLPKRGLARLRARAWLAVLYAFFRWQTGLRTHELPPSENLIEAAGLTHVESRSFQWGLLQTTIFANCGLRKPDTG